jgi:hypothetical protein
MGGFIRARWEIANCLHAQFQSGAWAGAGLGLLNLALVLLHPSIWYMHLLVHARRVREHVKTDHERTKLQTARGRPTPPGA